MWIPSLIGIIFALQTLRASAATDCVSTCNIVPNWMPQQQFCAWESQGKVTYNLTLCEGGAGLMAPQCFVEQELTRIDIGPCGCPNTCHQDLFNGVCSQDGNGESSCFCKTGWAGKDCSMVVCENAQLHDGNKCSERGTCETFGAFQTCICENGYLLNDCSAESVKSNTPPILTPGSQYTKWDDYGYDHPLFNDSSILQIYVDVDPKDLDVLMDPHTISDRNWTTVKNTLIYNGVVNYAVSGNGIRVHGWWSRNLAKKSFKLSLKELSGLEDTKDKLLYQQDEVLLKSANQDPSFVREKVSSAVAYSLNSPITREGYAMLYINGQHYGLYVIIEDIGKSYLNSRFGNEDGALYKLNSGLQWLGSNPETYKNLKCGYDVCYDPETDAAQNFTRLIEFLDILNNTPDDQFESAILSVFDVDMFLRTYVMEVATGNWDGIWDGNNYYLYFNPATNVFQYFRHDLDLSFGTFEGVGFGNFTTRNIYTWGVGGNGHIISTRILSVPDFRANYTAYFRTLLKNYFYPDGDLIQYARILQTMIAPAVKLDHWRFVDYGWTFSEFETSLNETLVRSQLHPKAEIFVDIEDFIFQRYTSAVQQLDP